jgi:hypothetical protein
LAFFFFSGSRRIWLPEPHSPTLIHPSLLPFLPPSLPPSLLPPFPPLCYPLVPLHKV